MTCLWLVACGTYCIASVFLIILPTPLSIDFQKQKYLPETIRACHILQQLMFTPTVTFLFAPRLRAGSKRLAEKLLILHCVLAWSWPKWPCQVGGFGPSWYRPGEQLKLEWTPESCSELLTKGWYLLATLSRPQIAPDTSLEPKAAHRPLGG